MNLNLNIISIILLSVTLLTLFQGIHMVPQGYRYIVERFGRYTKTLKPGLQFIIPFIDHIGKKQSLMEQVLDITPQEVLSSDNAQVQADAICFYQVQDPIKASYEVNHLEKAIQNLVMTSIRAVLGSIELNEILSNRDRINTLLLRKIGDATDKWGIQVTRVEIRDISPPKDLVDAMARQMKAERDKRAMILEAEGKREAAIKVAEGDKVAQILNAEGALEAAKREAEARERLAEAEGRATDLVSQAIAQGNIQAINYFIAQKYIEALKELAAADNGKVIMLPLETTSALGSIAGIKELVKAATETSDIPNVSQRKTVKETTFA